MVKKEGRLNIVFMGTPIFASIILQKIMQCNEFNICAVYCQPDRASGRGRKIIPCPVKVIAQNKFNIHQPINFKDITEIEILNAYKPDFLAVAAYGLILPQKILDIPRYAPLNVHASLLPLYRGAAPIQRAIWDNQDKTGISIMYMEKSLDTGPIYAQSSLIIGEHTSETMHNALAKSGGDLLIECMHNIALCGLKAYAQNDSEATCAPKLTKDDGIINWERTCAEVHAQIRAVDPWPNAQIYMILPNDKIYQAHIFLGKILSDRVDAPCGSIWHSDNSRWGIVCLDKVYEITHIKLIGKKRISASEFSRAYFPKVSNIIWGRVLSSQEIIKNV